MSSSLKKLKVSNKGLVVKPMIPKKMKSGAQADLIDTQFQPDGDLKWILVYRDLFTKLLECVGLKIMHGKHLDTAKVKDLPGVPILILKICVERGCSLFRRLIGLIVYRLSRKCNREGIKCCL